MKSSFIREFEIDKQKYVYDFEQMSVEQSLTAETFFRLNDKMFKVLPAQPDDVSLAGTQFALKNAYAALLCKVKEDGTLEEFDPLMTNNLAVLKKLKGTQARQDLEACRDDFFMRCGLATSSSAESLTNLMSVVKAMPEEQQGLMFNLILESVKGLQGNSSEKSSIIQEPSADG